MLQVIGKQYKVVGASTGLAIHLWAIIHGGYLPALMTDLVPAASCAIAMGLLGLDLTLPASPHAQVRHLANLLAAMLVAINFCNVLMVCRRFTD